jgi:tetratricopeptide (TPR) repeat protein
MESLDETLRWRRTGPAISAIVNRRWLAHSLTEMGRFPEAIAVATEAVHMAETADHPFSLTNALVGLGFALLRKGDVEPAIPLLERGCEVSRSLRFDVMLLVCAIPLASAYGLSGRSAEAARVTIDPRIESVFGMPVSLAESCLLGGRLDEASQLASRDLERARAQKSRAWEAWALHVLGCAAAEREPSDARAAQHQHGQALALAEDLGMRPLAARCHLALGKLYLRTGSRQEAQEHLTTAISMYREMDMRLWLEQAEGEVGALG